ncbi:SEC-C metal-binding domain-containing protein [Novosphingobium marinum]
MTGQFDPFSEDGETMIAPQSAGTASGAGLEPLPQGTAPRTPGQDPYKDMGLSRNAICPCGSGKKYKHCHGALA